jgi:hypothetical protein
MSAGPDTPESRALTVNIEKAMKDPSTVFGTPEVLDASPGLTAQQKRTILLQWKDQLLQLLTADDESMLGGKTSANANADCLQRVTNVLARRDTSMAQGHDGN